MPGGLPGGMLKLRFDCFINQQSTWVFFCTHVPDCFVEHFVHALFDSLSFAALEAWLTGLTKAGSFRQFLMFF